MKCKFLLGIVLLVACNRPDSTKVKPETASLKAVYASKHLEETTPDIGELRKVLKNQSLYEKVEADLDFNKVGLLSSTTENILIFIVGMRQTDRFYAVRAYRFKELIIQDELLYTGRMKDDDNGTIGILKRDEAIEIQFRNGVRSIRTLTENEYKSKFIQENDAVTGFCQRGKNQNYGDCFNHEVEEFCDSFWSCVALNTNPQVIILIGLSCSCDAASTPAQVATDTIAWPRGIDPSKTFDSIQPSPTEPQDQ